MFFFGGEEGGDAGIDMYSGDLHLSLAPRVYIGLLDLGSYVITCCW